MQNANSTFKMTTKALIQLFLISTIIVCCSTCTNRSTDKLTDDKDKTIGIGVISINYGVNGEEDSIVNIFKSAEDKIPMYQFTIKELDLAFRCNEDTLGFNPLEFMPTPGRIMFRCIDSINGMYKVVINENSGTEYWIRKGKNIDLTDWLSYLEGSEYIQADDPLREMPDDNAPIILNRDSCFLYQILAMKGEWIQVESSGYCNIYREMLGKPNIHEIKGWVKWRNGNKLMVGKGYAE